MASGWHNESRRHALASKGVKTTINSKPVTRVADLMPGPNIGNVLILNDGKKVIVTGINGRKIRIMNYDGTNKREITKEEVDRIIGFKDFTQEGPITLSAAEEKRRHQEYYEDATILPKEASTSEKLLERKQLLLIQSGIPIGTWERKTNQDEYVVWGKPQEPMRNPNLIVIKKEYSPKTNKREWVVFSDMGDAGTSIINRGGTKNKNLLIAKEYMMKRK